MRKILFLSFMFSFVAGYAQEDLCNCQADLLFLNQKVEKLPSYKKHKASYESSYESILPQALEQMPTYDCFILMNLLLSSLNDWHIGVYGPMPDSANISNRLFPKYEGNPDTLKSRLQEKPQKDLEGIYHYGPYFSFALVPAERGHFKAIVLHSKFEPWETGDIIYQIAPLHDRFYKIMGAQFPSQRLVSYHERIENGVFYRTGFKKDTVSNYYFKNPYPDSFYLFKALSSEVDYIKVGSFSSNYPRLGEAEDFYASLQGQLSKPHLILDLRDNGGGGDRNSDILWKLLKRYAKKNHIYVITNASTGSNAEQFVLKLKRLKNVISFGDRTRGALAYEVKPNDYHSLPSSGLTVVLPSKLNQKYYEYETQGVIPDHILDDHQGWIASILAFIDKKGKK